jgi:sulfur carrier protein
MAEESARTGLRTLSCLGGEKMVLINGEKTSADGMTVKACIDERGYNPLAIAVELNEEILPKAEYAETVLKDGDVLEIVNFVGGG